MKNWIKAACTAFVLTVIFSVIPFQADCRDVADNTFRLHILANSDSDADQALKLKVRDKVLSYTAELCRDAPDKETSMQAVGQHLREIAEVACDEVRANGYDYPVKAEITRMYFSTRHYDGYTLPAGMYDALRLSIGKAEGHNWWCVMYPSLCLSSATEREERAKKVYSEEEYHEVTDDSVAYKFKLVEWFEELQNLFR